MCSREAETTITDTYEWPNNVKESVRNPKITVVSLTFNKREFIKQCIDGVLMQDNFFSYEYIIAEDFSTDGTREIVKEYAERYPNIIRVITADYNMGIVKNQFRSIEFARGEYIAFCDADDYWTDPEKLKKQISKLEQYDKCHLSFHPVYKKESKNGKIEVFKKHAEEDKIFTVDELITGGGSFCITSSLVIKREAIKEINTWSLSWPINDYHTQIAAALNGGALYLNEIMAVYRSGVNESWTNSHLQNYEKNLNHILNVCETNRDFDKRTGFRFHKAFMIRERKIVIHFLRSTYMFEKKKIKLTKRIVRSISNHGLKARCYKILVLSFLYYRMKLKILFNVSSR